MPKPGKLPLNLFSRVKGPEYRHASLIVLVSDGMAKHTAEVLVYRLAHGSFAGAPEDAAKAFGSKPVRFARGALRTLSDVSYQKHSKDGVQGITFTL